MATTPSPGNGYVADYEPVFFSTAAGVTDWLMVICGTHLLPLPVEDMVFDYGVEARPFGIPEKLDVAAGMQMICGKRFEDAVEIGCGIIGVGEFERKVNIALVGIRYAFRRADS
jgi:hypothetical protein